MPTTSSPQAAPRTAIERLLRKRRSVGGSYQMTAADWSALEAAIEAEAASLVPAPPVDLDVERLFEAIAGRWSADEPVGLVLDDLANIAGEYARLRAAASPATPDLAATYAAIDEADDTERAR